MPSSLGAARPSLFASAAWELENRQQSRAGACGVDSGWGAEEAEVSQLAGVLWAADAINKPLRTSRSSAKRMPDRWGDTQSHAPFGVWPSVGDQATVLDLELGRVAPCSSYTTTCPHSDVTISVRGTLIWTLNDCPYPSDLSRTIAIPLPTFSIRNGHGESIVKSEGLPNHSHRGYTAMFMSLAGRVPLFWILTPNRSNGPWIDCHCVTSSLGTCRSS